MTSLADAKVKSVPFSGKKADFYGWTIKFLSYCHSINCKDVILGLETPPTDRAAAALIETVPADKIRLRMKKSNDTAMALLNLSMQDMVSQNAVTNAVTRGYANGLASKAWTNLHDIYRPKSVAKCNELEIEFTNCVLANNSKNPDEWFAELDFIKNQLTVDYGKQNIYNATKLVHHILYNVKCSLYNNLLIQLRRDETAREEAAAGVVDLNATYEALLKIKKEFREHYALVSHNYIPQRNRGDAALVNDHNGKKFTKPFKKDCSLCGKKGHKSADCWNHPHNPNKRKGPKKDVAMTMKERSTKKCNYCKKEGHFEADCWKKTKESKLAKPSNHAASMLISVNDMNITSPIYSATNLSAMHSAIS